MANGQGNETITNPNTDKYASVCVDDTGRNGEVYYYEILTAQGKVEATYGDYVDYRECCGDAELTLMEETIGINKEAS